LLGVFRSRRRHLLGLDARGDPAGDARVRRRIDAQGGSFPFMNWLAEGARGLSPAYFALVMATGIVSLASDRAEFRTIAAVLLWLNAGSICCCGRSPARS
jgi:hypothetical protein